MHDAFGVRLHAGKQAEVCHPHLKMPLGLVQSIFGFNYVDKYFAFGIKT
jgi:acid phosphatase family membrane protein YuiD